MIERIKSILLYALIILSVFLISIYFIPSSYFDFNESNNALVEYDSKVTLLPSKLLVNYGGKEHSAFFFDLSEKYIDMIKKINPVLDSLSGVEVKDYYEIEKLQSIKYSFPFRIPFVSIFSDKSYKPDIYVEEILIGKDDNHIYIKDLDKYYSIEILNIDLNEYFKLEIEDKYISIDDRYVLSKVIENSNYKTVYVPLESPILVDVVTFNDSYISDSEIERLLTNSFEGNRSFVRKITDENGNLYFIYAYGKKTLNIMKNNDVIYTQQSIGKEELTQFEAIKLAQLTINRFSKYDLLYLSSYNYDLNNNIHSFNFTEPVNGSFSTTSDKGNHYIEIKGDQVSYYKFNLTKEQIISNLFNTFDNGLDFGTIFELNFNEFYQNSKKIDENLDVKKSVYKVLSQINRFDFNYFYLEDRFVPAYEIELGNHIYQIDYYTGRILVKEDKSIELE
jgi:hypothetical protein